MTDLRTELDTDPEGLGYAELIAAGSTNRIADLLNEPRYPALGKVEITPMLIWLAKHGMMARLRTAAQSNNEQIASVAEVAMLLVQNPNISAIDFGLPDVQAMLGSLVTAGVIPQDAYDELRATAAVQLSRAQVLGLGTVDANDVSRALEG